METIKMNEKIKEEGLRIIDKELNFDSKIEEYKPGTKEKLLKAITDIVQIKIEAEYITKESFDFIQGLEKIGAIKEGATKELKCILLDEEMYKGAKELAKTEGTATIKADMRLSMEDYQKDLDEQLKNIDAPEKIKETIRKTAIESKKKFDEKEMTEAVKEACTDETADVQDNDANN